MYQNKLGHFCASHNKNYHLFLTIESLSSVSIIEVSVLMVHWGHGVF